MTDEKTDKTRAVLRDLIERSNAYDNANEAERAALREKWQRERDERKVIPRKKRK